MIIGSRRSSALLLLAIGGMSGACRSTPAARPPVPADAWAVVDGREIRQEEVEKAYRRAAQLSPVPSADEALTAKLALLNELIVQDILLAKAKELKIELPNADLDKAYAEGRKNLTEDQFQQELNRRNVTAADMREGLRRDLLAQKVLEREVVSKITVTDGDVQSFFNANRSEFNRAEEAYHLAQIIVTPIREPQQVNRSGNDAGTPQEAAAKVQMLLERLKAGTPFGDLAADFSEDPETAQRGGDLGFVPVSALQRVTPALRDAVLKAEPGTLRVVSNGGAHTIVFVVAREAAGQRDPSMPDVKERITSLLRGRREQLLRGAYLAAIRSEAVVANLVARRVLDAQGQMPSLSLIPPGTK